VWLDVWNLVPGDPWQQSIEDALNACLTCAIFVGPAGTGPWQLAEMRAAIDRRTRDITTRFRVIPVLLPGSEPQLLPTFLVASTWVRFKTRNDRKALHRLVCGIRGTLPGEGSRQTNAAPTHVAFVFVAPIERVSPEVENIIARLRQLATDASICLKRIEPGSTVLTLSGTAEGFARLDLLVRRGELKQVAGFDISEFRWATELHFDLDFLRSPFFRIPVGAIALALSWSSYQLLPEWSDPVRKFVVVAAITLLWGVFFRFTQYVPENARTSRGRVATVYLLLLPILHVLMIVALYFYGLRAFDRGFEKYSKGQFYSAITDFSSVLKRDSGNMPARYYRGISLMRQDSAKSALTDLVAAMRVNVDYGRQALALAAEGGYAAVVRGLIDQGVSPDELDNSGRPIIIAATLGGHVDVINILIEREANLDARGTYGRTALIVSAGAGNIRATEVLLDAGADRTIRSEDGRTALEIAQDAGYKDIVELLTRVSVSFANDTSDELTLYVSGNEYLVKSGEYLHMWLQPGQYKVVARMSCRTETRELSIEPGILGALEGFDCERRRSFREFMRGFEELLKKYRKKP
jgi:hypothetical protein